MSDLEANFQINLLEQQAHDARMAGQFATAEALFVEAARLADIHASWPIRVRIHSYLADCRSMQQQYEAALTTYTWLISLVGHPEANAALAGTFELGYLYVAYLDFVEVGRQLPAMLTVRLHRVLDEAERFLTDIGRPEWAPGLHLQRGLVLQQEGRLAQARQTLETGLAMHYRNPDKSGYTSGSYLYHLAQVLVELEEYEEASRCYCKIWEGREHSLYVRRYAASGMAQIAYKQQTWVESEHWAREGLALAAQIESPQPQFEAREVLLPVLLTRGKVAEVVREGAALYRWGRCGGTVKAHYDTAQHLCRVRLACARDAAGLSSNPDDPLPVAPPEMPPRLRQRAKRFLATAYRWLDRAQDPARRLDAQANVTRRKDELHALVQQLDEIAAWLEGPIS